MSENPPGIKQFFLIICYILLSWLLVHFLAIFGVFVALTYPVWWFFYPKLTFCIFCRSRKEGEMCPFCHQIISKQEGLMPKNITSVLLNGLLILIFSMVSLGLVYIESQILYKMGFPPTSKTVSFVIPSKGQYRINEVFRMPIEIVGVETPINAVQADLGFDPEKIEAINISTEGSFANIFIQKEINNDMGYVRLTGGLPNPGFFSDRGLFGTVLFKGKSPGVVKIEFLPSSMALTNDGRGTNVLKDLVSASYLILPEKVSEEEEKLYEELITRTVLGEKTESITGAQLVFYEEDEEEKDVLGVKVEQEIQEEKKFNLFKLFLNTLEKVNRFTLDLWSEIFNAIFSTIGL